LANSENTRVFFAAAVSDGFVSQVLFFVHWVIFGSFFAVLPEEFADFGLCRDAHFCAIQRAAALYSCGFSRGIRGFRVARMGVI